MFGKTGLHGNVIAAVVCLLACGPHPVTAQVPWTFRWGVQRPDLVRYNRVEGLSLGARLQARLRASRSPVSLFVTGRAASARHQPQGTIELVNEPLSRRVSVSLFREISALDEEAGHLAIGNSLTGLLFGRDEGDYFMRTGMSVQWSPHSAARESFRVRVYGEDHDPVDRVADFFVVRAVDGDRAFRDNLVTDAVREYGVLVMASPWWGRDPHRVRGGVRVTARAATGDRDHVSLAGEGRLVVPLVRDLRWDMTLGGAGLGGDPPAQRLLGAGGIGSARGYPPLSMRGTRLVRGRGELIRDFPFGSLLVFTDLAWAGEGAPVWSDALATAGGGVRLVDGLIRLDGGWALRTPHGFRADLYLDGIH
ncbi:MAG: hypothetical protein OEZ65_04275 [Gemmatimonadota bacterium]|nr:hypothetical protein [Gemmatimonadota bacterium]